MTNKNIQIKYWKNGEWDKLYPISKTANILNDVGENVDKIILNNTNNIMSNVNGIISDVNENIMSNVNGIISDVNENINDVKTNVGELSTLATSNKNSVVESINEINSVSIKNNKRINELMVNVKDFGVIGDGLADDTIAIQSALDHFDDRGGNLFFPKGVYRVTSPLIFPHLSNDATTLKKIGIIGASAIAETSPVESTQFNYDGSEGALFDFRNGVDANTRATIRLENFTMRQNTEIELNKKTYGVYAYDVIDSLYSNIALIAFSTNIKIVNYSYYAKFDRIKSTYAEEESIRIEGNANNLLFDNCIISANKSCGLYVSYGGTGVNIRNSFFEQNESFAINISDTSKTLIDGCYFERNSQVLKMSGSTYDYNSCVIMGSYINTTADVYSIRVDSCDLSLFGNTIHAVPVLNKAYGMIYVSEGVVVDIGTVYLKDPIARFGTGVQVRFSVSDKLAIPTSSGTTLGSVVKRIKIYNKNGELEGYIPIYDNIT